MKQNSFNTINNLQQLTPGKRNVSFIKIKSLVYLLLSISFIYLIFNTSCANPGMPTGGDKDSIPPVMLRTDPGLRSTNFKGSDLRFTFDEFIIQDEISEKLVISPPMKKKPLIKMKGKTLIIEFQEKLKEEATYSLDFKDAVADNNEKNPIEDLRFSFSTGPVHDSLRVAGYVRDALSQEPVDKVLVILHRLHDYTAFIDSIPDYIGTTNEEGLFMIDNVSAGSYRLYGLLDSDNSLNYNQISEKIAFADSLIVPAARFVSEPDTIVKNNDTIVVSGHTDFTPGPQYLMMFEEEKFDQYLDSYKRNQSNKVDFIFTESLSDSFKINLISPVPEKEWLFIESNSKHDSITAWITDTLISKRDTLIFQLKYEALDTLHQLITKTDTLELLYETPKTTRQRKKKNDVAEVPTINLLHNISSTGHDIYRRITIEAPEPLASFETSMVHLYSVLDSVETPIPIEVVNDSNSMRKYFIEHNWEPNSDYLFQIDSAAARNLYGHPSMAVNQKFRTQKEDYYGKIILTISNLREPALVQLLSNDETERVLQKIQILEDGTIEFPFLKPDKYRIRVIMDPNQNGKWDTGFLAEGLQPEAVVYFPKIIKVRSNFEYKESLQMNYDATHKKELIDEELEKEEAKKKAKDRKKGEESD